MEKKSWKKLDGKFLDRQRSLSDVKCACGCGQFITVRSAKNKARGKPNAGYCQGHIWKGRSLPESAKKKMRENHADFSGEKNPNFGKGLPGKQNPNWQGGKTKRYAKKNHPGANTKKDREFRASIIERDKICVLCGNKTRLEVHHLRSWINHKEIRHDPANVVTLCKPCHARADNRHHKERVRPMLEAYLKTLGAH